MRLSFPEAEVTRSLSSNLLKRGLTNVHQEDVRVIDVNALMAKRIEALAVKMQLPENEGFVAGVQTRNMDVEALVGDEAGELVSGNVIKAQSESELSKKQAAQMEEEAKRMLEDAKVQAQNIIANAMKDAEKEKQKLLEAAKIQGYQEGKQKAEQEVSKLRQELAGRKAELEEEYQKLADELEPQFIDTITGIYEHIFHIDLRAYRDILVYLISMTMRKVEGNRSFLIHVSQEDYPYVSMQKKQMAAGATASGTLVEVVEDITLSKNECLIETEGGIFDCGVGTQLEELRQKLILLSYEK